METSGLLGRLTERNARMIRTRREELGWSQAKLAEAAGTSQQTVDRIERGKVHHSRAFDDIWIALGLEPLVRTHIKERVAPGGDLAPAPSILAPADDTDAPPAEFMPVFGMTTAPHALTETPIDFIERPFPLRNVVGAYAVLVNDESMAPAFRAGNLALVNPWLPARLEDDVIAVAAYDSKRRVEMGIFAGSEGEAWLLTKPAVAGTFRCEKAEWPTCHVIVGRFSHT